MQYEMKRSSFTATQRCVQSVQPVVLFSVFYTYNSHLLVSLFQGEEGLLISSLSKTMVEVWTDHTKSKYVFFIIIFVIISIHLLFSYYLFIYISIAPE